MGNRITEGRCVRCGADLLDLSEYLCTTCKKALIKESRARVAARKSPVRKRMKLKIGLLGRAQKA
jgi:predicted amidophosphoribosyltransferase